jgi:hypothetical protein
MEPDHIHFARLAQAERKAAQGAATKWQRESHLELAQRYEDLASALLAHSNLLGRDL